MRRDGGEGLGVGGREGGLLEASCDKSSVTTKIVASPLEGWEVVNNNYQKGYFSFQFHLALFHAFGHVKYSEMRRIVSDLFT